MRRAAILLPLAALLAGCASGPVRPTPAAPGPVGDPAVDRCITWLLSRPAAFDAREAGEFRALYLFRLGRNDGPADDWTIEVRDGACVVAKGAPARPDTTFNVSYGDWARILDGTLSGPWAAMTGRLKIEGDLSRARRFETLFARAGGPGP